MKEIIFKITLIVLFCYKVSADNGEKANATVRDRFYPRYHLAPPYGWMNDPNGFCEFNDEYHLFYQYNPESSQVPGIAHWGHAKSSDLFHWEHLPIAMYPDKPYDKSGVFSGSALVENNVMNLFYTGNLNRPNEIPNNEQRQIIATSTDGVNVVKAENNPIIIGADRQPNIRDPKVWKHEDTYYMVLGNSFNNNTLGRVLLYSSKDMIEWEEVSIIAESDGFLGFMWECPDFFELDGKFVLLFSPQGIAPQGDKYKNLFQTGYIVGDFDYATNKFTPTTEFKELDHGHDFYATQSIVDSYGRRIVVAWFDMWDENYPERNDGFTGFMTIPRELILTSDQQLIQTPVDEIALASGRRVKPTRGSRGKKYTLKNKAGEVNIRADASNDLKLYIGSNSEKVILSYDAVNGIVTLDRGGDDGVRRTEWRPQGVLKWRIFIDASSIELFCGEGEVTFSSRFFPDGPIGVRLDQSSREKFILVREINRTVPRGGRQFTTIPRELILTSDEQLIQTPVDEIALASGRRVKPTRGSRGKKYTLKNKAGEVNIRADASNDLKLYIGSNSEKVILSYDAVNGAVTLDRGGDDGVRRTEWRPQGVLKWRIFIDASSIELFCGEGEVTFSSRFFPDGPIGVRLDQSSREKFILVREINRTVPRGGHNQK